MTKKVFQEGNPLLREDQYSGKIFWLNRPSDLTLSLEKLREQMSGQTFQEDISDRIDCATTEVPEMFIDNGRVIRTTTISQTQIVNTNQAKVLIGSIVLDDPFEVTYRDKKILILDTTAAHFLVLKFEGHYYLVILSRRETAEGAAAVLKKEYNFFGSMINPTKFNSDSIEEIREDLDAKLRDTTISDYPEEAISRIQITGQDLEDVEEFKRQRRRGNIKTHMIQTDALTPDLSALTLSISHDGLVRIYSTSTISTYISLLTKHILPNINRKVESAPSIDTYEHAQEAESIFVEIPDKGTD